MALVRVYIAVSLDGCVAGHDGGVGFLDGYSHAGYEEFFAEIGAVVMGRRTFDQALTFGDWPYKDKRTLVMTHRPLPPGLPESIEAVSGPPEAVIESLRGEGGDIWHMGGPASIEPFANADLIDRWELFVIPELVGGGIRLFGDGWPKRPITLTRCVEHPQGIVELRYERGR